MRLSCYIILNQRAELKEMGGKRTTKAPIKLASEHLASTTSYTGIGETQTNVNSL